MLLNVIGNTINSNRRSGQSILPFQFTINTNNLSTGSSASNQFQLPLVNAFPLNFLVDWGDGFQDVITNFSQPQTLHTYASSGVYMITITGDISGWQFNNSGDRLKILNVFSWGTFTNFTGQLTMVRYSDFFGCANLTSNATDSPILGLALNQFFRGCTSLNGGVSNWNMSSVTSVNGMFRSANSFNQNIGSWDVSSVKDFTNMFLSQGVFNNGGSPSINNWNTSSATNMSQMFFNVTAFNQPIGNWDVSNVTSMLSMFGSNPIFNQDISGWNVSSVTNMQSMFSGCTAFQQYLGSWNISNVTAISNFMGTKTEATFPSQYLDDIYNGWSSRPVQPNLSISFGTAKYTASAIAGRAILTSAPNNWTCTDGGLV